MQFRTGRQVPKCFQDEDSDGSKRCKTGRPQSFSEPAAFLKVADNLRHSDEEQTTINDLIIRMKDYLGDDEEPYSFRHMKEQLQTHFDSDILISEVKGKQNVVTFRRTASAILHDFFEGSKRDGNYKERLIMAAAELLKSDIKSVVQTNSTYPTSLEMSSVMKTLLYVPQSLQLFLRTLFVGREKELLP